MTHPELRENCGRIIRAHMDIQNTTEASIAFVVGYTKACRDAGALTLGEDQAAEAAISGRIIPDAVRSCIFWGMAV